MSDSYYITARHNKKKIHIPIEEKHQYNSSARYMRVVKENTTSSNKYIYGNGFSVHWPNVSIITSSNWYKFENGSSEEKYIGDKIQLKSLDTTLELNFTKEFLDKWYGIGDDSQTAINKIESDFKLISNTGNLASITIKPANFKPFWVNCRLMAIQFDDKIAGDTGKPPLETGGSDNETMEKAIAEWFNETYIYYESDTSGNNTMIKQSVHQDKLRESTKYSGSFKRLYDKKFKLKENKPLQMEFILPINKNVNIDEDTGKITHESFKNIYIFLLTSGYNKVDMSPNLYRTIETGWDNADSYSIGELGANLKLTYYDL